MTVLMGAKEALVPPVIWVAVLPTPAHPPVAVAVVAVLTLVNYGLVRVPVVRLASRTLKDV